MTHTKDDEIYLKLKCWGFGKTSAFEKWDDGGGGRLRQILIWHTKFISGIQAIYERNNAILVCERHGGGAGDLENIYLERPLTWISGHCKPQVQTPKGVSKVITSLKFGNEEKTYGPFGVEDGEPFVYRGEDEIVGLHGWKSSDSGHLSAIGPYIKIKGVTFADQNKPIKREKAI